MNLRQLEYFRVLGAELNFTRAAERLNMAQPPLSRQIKLLEEDLGISLFARSKRSVKLTAEGEYLMKEVGHTFHQLDNIKANLRQIRDGRSGAISIGYVGAAMHSVLPDILRTIFEKYKKVSVRLHEMDNTQQVEALKKGSIDIGFLRSMMDDPDLDLLLINKEPFALITSRKLKVKSERPADLSVLAGLPFICFPTVCAPDMVKGIHDLARRLRLSPPQIHESSQINSIVRLVESGIGYAILPASVNDVYRFRINSLDLSHHAERAVMYAGFNPQRKSVLVENMLNIVKHL